MLVEHLTGQMITSYEDVLRVLDLSLKEKVNNFQLIDPKYTKDAQDMISEQLMGVIREGKEVIISDSPVLTKRNLEESIDLNADSKKPIYPKC